MRRRGRLAFHVHAPMYTTQAGRAGHSRGRGHAVCPRRSRDDALRGRALASSLAEGVVDLVPPVWAILALEPPSAPSARQLARVRQRVGRPPSAQLGFELGAESPFTQVDAHALLQRSSAGTSVSGT